MKPDTIPSIAPYMPPSETPDDSTILVAHTIIGDETVIVDVGTSFIKVQEACQRHASDFARLMNNGNVILDFGESRGYHNRTAWHAFYRNFVYTIELRKVTS